MSYGEIVGIVSVLRIISKVPKPGKKISNGSSGNFSPGIYVSRRTLSSAQKSTVRGESLGCRNEVRTPFVVSSIKSSVRH